jgi:hypothetical protein
VDDPILSRVPLRSQHLYGLSLSSVGLCVGLWIRAKTIGEDERGNAERRALFIGLWPPLLWLIGDSLGRATRRRDRRLRRGRRRRSRLG